MARSWTCILLFSNYIARRFTERGSVTFIFPEMPISNLSHIEVICIEVGSVKITFVISMLKDQPCYPCSSKTCSNKLYIVGHHFLMVISPSSSGRDEMIQSIIGTYLFYTSFKTMFVVCPLADTFQVCQNILYFSSSCRWRTMLIIMFDNSGY